MDNYHEHAFWNQCSSLLLFRQRAAYERPQQTYKDVRNGVSRHLPPHACLVVAALQPRSVVRPNVEALVIDGIADAAGSEPLTILLKRGRVLLQVVPKDSCVRPRTEDVPNRACIPIPARDQLRWRVSGGE